MKRDKLLNNKGYWLTQIQNELFGVIENYMNKKNLNRTKLAKELNVTKGYITQIMNGDFDHKISKLVELSLACNTVPLVYFVNKDEYIKADSQDKFYDIIPIPRPKYITYQSKEPFEVKIEKTESKKRPHKYEEKVAVKGTFADVFKVVKKNKEQKKKS